MKIFLIITLLICFNTSFSQESDRIITLTASGQGKTNEEAKLIALRAAIEQAFGSFISSNTNILNDKIVKDEIVSITNGSIKKYEIISETTLDKGNVLTILKATVSIDKLSAYCESKGVKIEFNGGLFAINMALQDLNNKNELKVWENTKEIIYTLMYKSFDYTILVSEPKAISNTSYFEIPIKVESKMNENYSTILKLLLNFCKAASLNNDEVKNYKSHNKDVYPLSIDNKIFYLRNLKVYNEIAFLPWMMAKIAITNFKVDNGIDKYSLRDYINRTPYIDGMNETFIEISEMFDLKYIIATAPLDAENDNYDLSKGRDMYSRIATNKYKNLFHKGRIEKWENLEGVIDGGNIFLEEKENSTIGKEDFKRKFKFLNITDFLKISYNEKRSIDEIKRINNYKVYSKFYQVELKPTIIIKDLYHTVK